MGKGTSKSRKYSVKSDLDARYSRIPWIPNTVVVRYEFMTVYHKTVDTMLEPVVVCVYNI